MSTSFKWKPPSNPWLSRANLSIAHGALTNSKRPESHVPGIYPSHLLSGHGCHVWDPEGKRYIDFICGLGTSILGHAQVEVNRAAINAIELGSSLSMGSPYEVEAAEKIKEVIPFIDRVRFLKTGSEACSAAIRIAREFTGRRWILSEGYHGWHDEFIHCINPDVGPRCESKSYENIEDINEFTAAIILEPFQSDVSERRRDEIQKIRRRCSDTGALLIFDEIITGFRFPQWTASRYIGIEPDLITLGKACANGFSLSVVGGKSQIMESDYFVSSTFAGELAPLAACKETLTLLQKKYSLLELWDKGAQFLCRFNELWREGVYIEGYPTRGIFRGDDYIRALFFQEACKAGILFGPSWFFNFSHIGVMDMVLSACADIMRRIQSGAVKLEGAMPIRPFAQRVRDIKQ